MGHAIFVICCIYMIQSALSLPFQKRERKYVSISLNEENKKSTLYSAVISGDKTSINGKVKKQLKALGLLHLFTPSGLHLSSFFFMRFLPKKILIPVLVLLFIYLSSQFQYLSMERVLIFKLLHLTFRNLGLSLHFTLTFIISFLLGQFNEPLSFLYSLVFWGTILIFRNNPIKCVFYLCFQNLMLNSLQGAQTNFLIFIINPILTFIVSGAFPLLFFNSLLPSWAEINLSFFFTLIEWILINLPNCFSFKISFSFLLVFFLYLKNKHTKLLIVILLLTPTVINRSWNFRPQEKFILGPGPSQEIIQGKAYQFVDRSCDEYLNCRRKRIEWGGIKI